MMLSVRVIVMDGCDVVCFWTDTKGHGKYDDGKEKQNVIDNTSIKIALSRNW